jgi:hypothetical protein
MDIEVYKNQARLTRQEAWLTESDPAISALDERVQPARARSQLEAAGTKDRSVVQLAQVLGGSCYL